MGALLLDRRVRQSLSFGCCGPAASFSKNCFTYYGVVVRVNFQCQAHLSLESPAHTLKYGRYQSNEVNSGENYKSRSVTSTTCLPGCIRPYRIGANREYLQTSLSCVLATELLSAGFNLTRSSHGLRIICCHRRIPRNEHEVWRNPGTTFYCGIR